MKSLILSILLILGLYLFTPKEISAQKTITYSDWKLSNDGCWGCASFYWAVSRTTYTDLDGYYYYYIYFYSNSYTKSGEWASTYVWDINLTVDKTKIAGPIWISFKESYTPNLLWFKSKSSNSKIYLSWGGLKLL